MAAREGTRKRRISVLHMLGTWEEKIEGCNCPKCKECPGKSKTESPVRSPTKPSKGPKSAVKKVSPKSKITDSKVLQESSAKNRVKDSISDSEACDSELTSESASVRKSNTINNTKGSEAVQQVPGDSGVDNVRKIMSRGVEESEAQDLKSIVKQSQKRQSLSPKDSSPIQIRSKLKAEDSTSKLVVSPQKSSTEEEEEDPDDQSTNHKQRRISTDESELVSTIMIKEEPEEYLSDLDDSDKPQRGRYSDKKGETRSKRARMVTSEMENIYAKPRMIFTGKGVVRKFEPGVDRTPKSKRGRKPGKALLPVNIKQEPKELEVVKQELEGTDVDELQKALSEAAENISGMGDELLDVFHELGEGTRKIKPRKKSPTPFFKRLEGNGDKYVECNICFKVLKESSMKQHYRTHTGEKPHMCDICHSRFTRKGDVGRHKRLVHKNQKPYKCQKCGKEFADHKNLKAHLQNHDKAIYYGCTTCGFKFGKKEYYENHIRYIHPLPGGTVPAFSSDDDDIATKQLKQIEMEERKKLMQKSRILELDELEEEDDDEDDDDDEEDLDDDDDDKAIEITVTDMDEQNLFTKSELLAKKEDSMDGASTNTHEDDDEEEEEEEEEESNTVISALSNVRQKAEVPRNSSLIQLVKSNTPQPTRVGTNMKVSKGMLSLTQTISDNDSQDEDLVNKVIAAAVSQATDTIESLQAKSGGNLSGNEIEFGDEEETEEDERLEGADDLQDILGGTSYEMLPMPNEQKTAQQPAEIHITASVSGQQRKFIIQVPPGTNLNVQTPEGMEMIVNIVNQLCAGKGELDGPIEVVMNNPSNRLTFVNNKR